MTFKESIKKLYVGEEWVRSLHAFRVPLSDMFESVREDQDFKVKKEPGEYFLSVKAEGINRYYWVRLTPSFAEYMKHNTFTGISGFEVIQQQKTIEPLERMPDSNAYKFVYIDSFLVVAEESQILGSVYLDYKEKTDIFDFFGLDK